MNNELKLSNKSKEFLDNLRIYLFSSGKKSDEIDDIVEELEIHLHEAERNGKPIEKVIGKTPEAYMEMISDEMMIDYRTWIKYIWLIIFGAFSVTIFMDLLEGNLNYSILEIVGDLIITAIFIATVFTGFKYLSKNNLSKKIQWFILFGIAILPIALFVGLMYLNKIIETPIIHFGHTGSLIIGIIAILFLICMSYWAKTWILIILMALLALPGMILNQTSLQYETQLIVGQIITLGGIVIYLWIASKLEKSK